MEDPAAAETASENARTLFWRWRRRNLFNALLAITSDHATVNTTLRICRRRRHLLDTLKGLGITHDHATADAALKLLQRERQL
eukprot:CAMPEP_0198208598 /NCGR_PEP_ID=MMETSP1445-20131203/11942_1 /TAXON_ID=36898 /ORGANISM="Pyramimonas sp., Strain CCMP2087" /LENGTH=82 /DNA_ID=CAMNT_0043882051 /DNA_START=166 /DNA_END=411 /DNA_ORIENTATION=-